MDEKRPSVESFEAEEESVRRLLERRRAAHAPSPGGPRLDPLRALLRVAVPGPAARACRATPAGLAPGAGPGRGARPRGRPRLVVALAGPISRPPEAGRRSSPAWSPRPGSSTSRPREARGARSGRARRSRPAPRSRPPAKERRPAHRCCSRAAPPCASTPAPACAWRRPPSWRSSRARCTPIPARRLARVAGRSRRSPSRRRSARRATSAPVSPSVSTPAARPSPSRSARAPWPWRRAAAPTSHRPARSWCSPATGGRSAGSCAPYGPGWEWVLAAAAGFEVEGRSLEEFLAWVSHETGWQVRFEDPALAASARPIVLHGAIGNLPPDQAPFAVLPGAGLEGKLEGKTLVIRSRG